MWEKQWMMGAAMAALAIVVGVTRTNASVTYEFGSKASTFDGETSVDVPVTDLDTGVSAIMTAAVAGSADNAELNSNTNDFGVQSDADGDSSTYDRINGTEALSLTFDKDVQLVLIDLGNVGGDSSEGVTVTIDTLVIDLWTGQPDFGGTSDIYAPEDPVEVFAGTPIVFSPSGASSEFDIEELQFTVIPEPASLMLLGLGGLAMITCRRKGSC